MCFRPSTAAKLKICPGCGSANQPIRANCSKCKAELASEEVFNLIDPSAGRPVNSEIIRKSQKELQGKQLETGLPSYRENEIENYNSRHLEENIKNEFKTDYDFSGILGESDELDRARKLAGRFAPSSANILLIGESGTGKELFAQAVHSQSRPAGPFMVLNCAAIPRNLIESELFGYDGGAFTGAKKSGSQGKIELAQRGTLFLDEIGDIPLETQAVLLRVLENKQVMRVGGQKYRPVDFRLIAATNKDLQLMVDDGLFRLDLYYRLSVLKINIPPLRQRGRDIITLAKFFLKKHCSDGSIIPTIDKDTQLKLMAYHWPGNVRQLENAMIYALHIHDNGTIMPECLPDEIVKRNISQHVASNHSFLKLDRKSKVESILEVEENAIKNTLFKTGNNIALTAELLGISKSTLYRKVKILGIK